MTGPDARLVNRCDVCRKPVVDHQGLADTGLRARSLQRAFQALRAGTPGWADDAMLEALEVLADRIAFDLAVAERDAA